MEQARLNMIEQQIRTWDVLDQRVLDLIQSTLREEFVPEAERQLAYADINIPLGHGEIMMPPKMEARLIQALNIRPNDSVLEVGTGSAYLTALLAKSARHVYSVDIYPEFCNAAKAKLADHGINNVTIETGDASKGWDGHAPYNVIAITGALPSLPQSFKNALQRAGRLVAVIGTPPVMEAILVTRVGEREWIEESLFETQLPYLVHAEPAEQFVF